ncbi:universal stress protein [Streptomyces albipurpureus]|uniref:Universal stress protein n=1 Tax=Streptomyces albipurpureus TaxID=2897419 RepID=A0ABT0UJC2_9ACTN|nr:universal stress protein [Streptomyces sp. CWNU-1]MCM2388744.1 universal stress protein [Streptomyces sp. CWNU-1]
MTVIAWIVEGTWPACVDAVRSYAPDDTDVVLLHTTGPEVPGVARGAYAGLLGRGHHPPDPGERLRALAAVSAERILTAAADRLARPCARLERTGRPEREVVSAAGGAELLVLARDGERTRPGPRSLGPASRFIVDHAPCPVLLVWPGTVDEHPPPGPGPQSEGPPPAPGPAPGSEPGPAPLP